VKTERVFPCAPASVTAARRFVMGLIGAVPADVADSIGVMVSELATNAVSHAASGFTVVVDVEPDGISIAVSDRGPGHPAVRSPRPTERTGRGLRIVDAFADTWGIDAAPGTDGKTVWFTVQRPVATHDGMR
jgi:anti-sigma regulatory factor (Ser/Thr protein kinase)